MFSEHISEINIIYNINQKDNFIEEEDIINIFGNKFVKNNKNNCKLEIGNKEYEITDKFNIKNYNNNILNIKLKGADNITNMSYMFYGCPSLISLPDFVKLNTINVTDMSFMFMECKSLISLPDISKWNTNNTTNISGMFRGVNH